MKKLSLAVAGVLLAGSMFALTACDDGGSVGKVNGNFKKEATALEVETALENVQLEKAFGTGDTIALQMLGDFEISAKQQDTSSKMNLSFDYALQGPKAAFGGMMMLTEEEGDEESEISWKDYALAAAGQFVSTGSFNFKTKTSGEDATSIGAKIYQDANYLYLDVKMDAMSPKVKISISELLDLIGDSMQPDEPEDDTTVLSDIGMEITGPSESSNWALLASGFKPYIDNSKGLKIKFEGDSQMILDAFTEAGMTIDASMLKSSVLDIYLAFDENGLFTQLGVDVNVQVKAEGMNLTVKGGMALKPYSGTVTLPLGIALDPTYISIPLSGSDSIISGI
ncbi:MAG: hypothetical protein K2G44_01515 [Clostridia bacterium]|nr:hypothetical protein [Clostridia bacterium]